MLKRHLQTDNNRQRFSWIVSRMTFILPCNNSFSPKVVDKERCLSMDIFFKISAWLWNLWSKWDDFGDSFFTRFHDYFSLLGVFYLLLTLNIVHVIGKSFHSCKEWKIRCGTETKVLSYDHMGLPKTSQYVLIALWIKI